MKRQNLKFIIPLFLLSLLPFFYIQIIEKAHSEEALAAAPKKAKKIHRTQRASSKAAPKRARSATKTQSTPRRSTRIAPSKPAPSPVTSTPSESAPDTQTDSSGFVQAFDQVRRDFRAGNYLTVIEKSRQLARSLRNRDRLARLHIVQGLAYYKLELKTAALDQFLIAVKNQPDRKDLRSAMTNAVAAAREVRAEEELLSVLSSFSPNELSRKAKESFYYRLGKALIKKDEPDRAIDFLSRVPDTSERILDAKFLLGVAWNMKKDRARAYLYFRDILTRGIKDQDDQVVWELANLNAARVSFAQRDFIRAIDHYRRIPRSSQFWLDALFESSWPLLHLDQYNWALGNLKTLHSPYFMEKFYPESIILRAILLFRLCKYSEMKRAIKFYRKEYDNFINLIAKYLKQNQSTNQAFYKDVTAYTSETEGDPGEIPGKIWDWVISDVTFKELKEKNDIYDAEQKALSKASLSAEGKAYAEGIIRHHQERYQVEVNAFVRNKLALALDQMRSLDDQINIIELQQTLGEKQVIEETSEPQSKAEVEVDVEVAEGYDLWPFTGEYWKDELGFFAYSTGDSCQYE